MTKGSIATPDPAYLLRILAARVYDVAVETPLTEATGISRRLGCRVLLKREDLQSVFSFKLRGAYNKIAHLAADEQKRGVICASAGNHAQGVALAAKRLGTRAVVVMPETTPKIKVEAVHALDGEVVLCGETYDDAYLEARGRADREGLVFVHPFDDPEVIAGQATIGQEILRQHEAPLEAVFVPVGGGGLAAGVAFWIKTLRPEIEVWGVEPEDAAAMHAAFEAGEPTTLDEVGTFVDGVAVRRVGAETYRLCRQYLDGIILVTTDEVCAAIRSVFEDTRAIMEPAGALAVAGLIRHMSERSVGGDPEDDQATHVAITGGANMNFDRLRHIAERTDLGAGREALLAVEIPERKGSFERFCSVIGERHVTEFNYRFGDPERAAIFVGVELRHHDERRVLIEELEAAGYPVVDLSENEAAKMHVRYMVGGYGHGVENERLLRFRFPERRGALRDFLRAIGSHYNISLFHYRNHGDDSGRVLAGLQVPEAQYDAFEAHLDDLGFPWQDESANPAFRLFLATRS